MPLKVGQTVNNNQYEVLRWIAEGGFSNTYQALDTDKQRYVVIKESKTTDNDVQNMLLQEVKSLGHLNHPSLPRISDYFYLDGRICVVMDYIPGKDLETFTDTPNDIPCVLTWIDQLLDALAYMHRQQPHPIIHRDIKPSNLRLNEHTGRICLLDAGISKSGSGTQMLGYGTPPYCPPEQYGRQSDPAKRSKSTPATDVYAVGAVLYELLTGKEPPESLAIERGTETLTPPRTLNPAISAELERVILKAMQVKSDQRYQNAQAMRDALKAAIGDSGNGGNGGGGNGNGGGGNGPHVPWKVVSVVAVALVLVVVLLFVLFSGVGQNETSSGNGAALPATPTAMLPPTHTSTPLPLPTDTPLPTLTPTDTPTPAPTSTTTPTPTVTPTPIPMPNAAQCGDIPAPVDATVEPATCVFQGTTIEMNFSGFAAGEDVSVVVTTPDGQVGGQQTTAGESGGVKITYDTTGLAPGLWQVQVSGTGGNTASAAFTVVSQ